MDEVYKKRERYVESIETIQRECPEIADIPLSIGPASWFERVAERFRDRETEKTITQKTKLLEQTKRFFTEYRAALDAEDELRRVKSAFREKDEDAELRSLERQKKKLALEREIADLKKKTYLKRQVPGCPSAKRLPKCESRKSPTARRTPTTQRCGACRTGSGTTASCASWKDWNKKRADLLRVSS